MAAEMELLMADHSEPFLAGMKAAMKDERKVAWWDDESVVLRAVYLALKMVVLMAWR